MLLAEVKENNGWLLSRWNLTYRVSWKHICKAVQATYEFFDRAELLIDNELKSIRRQKDILKLDEAGCLTIRGISKIVKVPLMITFMNQTNVVEVNVACATDEFLEANYEKFNMSLCQYMDSIELAMYR